ncbi:proton channel OtopLc-like [Ischnura elegans]|uniref:proton channel OtopLc-like n=1 Tax=Ischnura elegans TaxID=197161 RepID=UPI001ED8ADBD|nr:proton channel OtopLc-like [Ischnura elegans]
MRFLEETERLACSLVHSRGQLMASRRQPSVQGRSLSLPFIQETTNYPTIAESATLDEDKEVDPSGEDSTDDSLTAIFSALYGKLLVVQGIAFPVAEVISAHVPPTFHEGFYLYLYCGSMLFLLYLCAGQLRPPVGKEAMIQRPDGAPGRTRYGSFYLRMGAVAFGIGSMIYSGLEFGLYFETERGIPSSCHTLLQAITPATRMAFIIVQMQFIFLKNRQIESPRHRVAVRFGLMHMIATNLCVWLNVLVQETKHEILTFYDPRAATEGLQVDPVNRTSKGSAQPSVGRDGSADFYECRRTNIMGSLVQNASPFLFPCTIEYSLICAVILYAMWRTSCQAATIMPEGPPSPLLATPRVTPWSENPQAAAIVATTSSQHFSVDCASAHRGLFSGILVLVLTIISLIMFLVLEREPGYAHLAILEVNACEVSLYVLTTLATLLCAFQIRKLKKKRRGHHALDCILLVIAQTGLYLYAMFSIVAGYFADAPPAAPEASRAGIMATAVVSLVQTTCQTVFVLDAWYRRCLTSAQARSKPGRQMVTFLLVTNMAMWTINRLQNSRADFHPLELQFYGKWAWTIITHVSMPLAIFYRFHSTVCLCEIWKSAYKVRD